jgi:uncharacterized secreted protein with C-terminal beta-propeller domain
LVKRIRVLTAVLIAAAVALPAGIAADGAAAATRSHRSAKKLRLRSFDGCSSLVRFARAHAREVERSYAPGGPVPFEGITGPPIPGAGGGVATDAPQAAPPAATVAPGDTSGTNVQEQGVDEPDAVKTDGKTIFAIANGDLHAVDARSAQPRLLGTLALGDQGQQLLLHGDRLLVIGTTYVDTPDAYYRPITVLTEVDVSDPAAMTMVRTELVEGSYVSARLTGDTSRIVVTSPPAAFDPGAPDALARRVTGWVPKAAVVDRRNGNTRRRRIVGCDDVRHPRTFAGLDMLTVLTIDMSRGLPAVDADSVMTSAEDVYASQGSLYVATRRWSAPPTSPDQPPPRGTTAIHRFDTSDPGSTTYKSSGEVPGYVLNQWAMSEYKGVLRVASTQDPDWWNGAQREESQSYVTTLADRGGALVPLGSVGGLGKGERIQGVRFIDDAGYVVTFRQTDPLYTVDLSNPTDPKVLGELKLLGYSAYLHPVGPGLLLGVGQDANEAGRQRGSQLSLFDVSDLRNPQRIQQRRLEAGSSSDAEFDHHAFLFWQPRDLAVVPLRQYESNPPFLGAVGLRVRRDGIAEVGRVQHDWGEYPGEVDRSVVVGDRLFTVSALGVKASDLDTFADAGRAEFPQPEQPKYPGPVFAIP